MKSFLLFLSDYSSGVKLSQEKQLEKSSWNKDHHRAIENLRKEHKRELDVRMVSSFWQPQ